MYIVFFTAKLNIYFHSKETRATNIENEVARPIRKMRDGNQRNPKTTRSINNEKGAHLHLKGNITFI